MYENLRVNGFPVGRCYYSYYIKQVLVRLTAKNNILIDILIMNLKLMTLENDC